MALSVQSTALNPARKPTTGRLGGFLHFLLFAMVAAATLLGLGKVLDAVPGTARMLHLAQAGTMTIPLVLTLDGLEFAGLVLLSTIAVRLEKRPLDSFGLPLRAGASTLFLKGWVWGVFIASLDLGITWLLGGFHFNGFALPPQELFTSGLLWAFAFVIVALFEESLYRGYALQALSTSIGFWPAAVCLSILFGGLHLLNPGETLLGALDVVSYALLACFTLQRTGNLWFAVGLHAAWDFSLTVLFSVPSSGMHAKGALLQSTLSGPTWLTGGADGPEGSLLGLAVLLGSFLLFLVLFPKQASPASDLRQIASPF